MMDGIFIARIGFYVSLKEEIHGADPGESSGEVSAF